VGEHDNGHAGSTCTCNRTSNGRFNEACTGREERWLHQQCHVEEYLRTSTVSVCGDMVSSGSR